MGWGSPSSLAGLDATATTLLYYSKMTNLMRCKLLWMGGSPSRLLVHLPVLSLILLQKIQKMAKWTFWYRLNRLVSDKVQRVVKWLCVCVCVC